LRNDNAIDPQNIAEGEEEEYNSDVEERDIEQFLDTEESDPAATAEVKIRGWQELHEQLKGDLRKANEQNATLTQINQLLILHNFATLHIKGHGRMDMSEQIAQQWHDGLGVHFAHQIRTLACHYQ
jgi:hypothetical protein